METDHAIILAGTSLPDWIVSMNFTRFRPGNGPLTRFADVAPILLGLICLPGSSLAAGSIAYHFERYAGTGSVSGGADGTLASRPGFSALRGIARDPAGNLYVADLGKNSIRKISTAGVVTTVAGNGILGRVDGIGRAAEFNHPDGLTLDAAGNIYVADQESIRKIAPNGTVTTLARNLVTDVDGSYRYPFDRPSGIVCDPQGVVYFSEIDNHAIFKLTPDGTLTTFAGKYYESGFVNASGAAARFNTPSGLALDAAGNLYVADIRNHAVRKISANGEVTTLAGGGGQGFADGPATSARFDGPAGVAVDAAGNVYVADTGNYRIRKISSTGVVTTVVGSGRGGQPGQPYVAEPQAVALTGNGDVYFTESDGFSTHRISKFSADGRLTVVSGADAGMGDGSPDGALFGGLAAAALDANGNLFLSDASNHSIRKISSAGVVTTFAGRSGVPGTVDGTGVEARFNSPAGLCFDRGGNLYVVDRGNHAIRKITASGIVSTIAGAPGTSGSINGPATTARFYYPNAIAADSADNLFIVDNIGRQIRKLSPQGVVTTLAGSNEVGYADGTGATAIFNSINTILVTATGDLLAGEVSGTIRRITQAGVVTTFAGLSNSTTTVDGPLAAARFLAITNLIADEEGNILLTDVGNRSVNDYYSALRKIGIDGQVTTISGPGWGGMTPSALARARDGTLFLAAGTAIFTGRPNRAPVMPDMAVEVYKGREVVVPLPYWDEEGDLLRYHIVAANHATAQLDGSAVVITANPGFVGTGTVQFTGDDGFAVSNVVTVTFTVIDRAPTFNQTPPAQVVRAGGTLTLAANATPPEPGASIGYRWQRNGSDIFFPLSASSATYTQAGMSPSYAGIYTATATSYGRTYGVPVIVGVSTTAKVLGGKEVGTNIVHANNNVYDQVLLGLDYRGNATVTADPGQILRLSFLDLQDDIVQIEFSGNGNLSVVPMADIFTTMLPVNYVQNVQYARGHVGIIITEATENTHLSVFSVGRATAVNQSLFRDNVAYDGVADIAFVAIHSSNGKFGSLRTANTRYWNTKSIAGVYAPGVQFTGPVYVHDIDAADAATPMLVLGGALQETRITGGDLTQDNNAAVQVDGLTRLEFTNGTTSHGVDQPAQLNHARLEQNGVDVTSAIVVDGPR